MSNMKNAIETILNCDVCNGHGFTGWADRATGDFDIEDCECNPLGLPDPKQVA